MSTIQNKIAGLPNMQAVMAQINFTATTKSFLMWLDSVTNRWLKEEITPAQYANLGNPPLPVPLNFVGTQADWTTAWHNGQAKAIGGRAMFDTPNGDTFFGAVRDIGGGKLFVHMGDQDNDPILLLDPADYTGTLPVISQAKSLGVVGVSIIGGVLTKT